MSKYFVPKLDPSQVWMPSEYLVAHGQSITLPLKESIIEADRFLECGERTCFAMPATFAVDGKAHSGVVAITTHRLICCSSVSHNRTIVSMPFAQSIGIGDESGLILKQIPVTCGSIAVEIKASGEHIKMLRDILLDAIEAAPNQKDLDVGNAEIFRDSTENCVEVQKARSAHSGERRLSKTEAAAYGPCPDCKGTTVIERGRKVYCLKCGHQLSKK